MGEKIKKFECDVAGYNRFFVSFIEEGWMGQGQDIILGRIEVISYPEGKDIGEIRYCTRKIEEFRLFEEKWDFKTVNAEELMSIKDIVEKQFCEAVYSSKIQNL